MHTIHKLASYTALILVSSLPLSFDTLADAEKKSQKASSVASNKAVAINKQKVLSEKLQNLINEAKGSLSGTQQALISLSNNDPKAARVLLQDVLTKLDILLVEHPAMVLVPADVEVDVVDYVGDAKTLEKQVKQADKLLDGGHLQDARQLLAGLASEMRITTVSIPLGTYPAVIKAAIAQIDADKNVEAQKLLEQVLDTLVEEIEVTPLPVLRAEAFLNKASEIEHQQDMAKADSRAEVLKNTAAAKDELKIAELLGYGSQDDFALLYTVIDDLKDEMHTEKSSATWGKIKKALTNLKDKMVHPGRSK
ncbi:MAG: YfdX family protein [Methylomonas sp.]|uniref:YfdX family protein n=1 Tax=Methylomonas sp. TaxID=418 RepID=UPI0025F7EF9B|nr:YfdX family protein [Methylomonas sp.]MCK9608246.1 YfdX family protein [Methylomonas sp.]